jgi:hypothetical protein
VHGVINLYANHFDGRTKPAVFGFSAGNR